MVKTALLIGVSQYDSDDLKPLPAAAGDVAAVEKVLRDRALCDFDHVLTLLNPDLSELLAAIENLFDNRKANDLVLLYFSGHGVTDEKGNFYFTNRTTGMTAAGRLKKSSATPAGFVHDLMENCPSDRQVIILDCCHSAAFPQGMTARRAELINFEQQLGGKGRIILASSAASEYSFERKGEPLAIYTRYLVEGIRTGAADLDGDGFISVNELHDYVYDQVQKAAPAMHPERYVLREGKPILLAIAPRDPQQEFRKLVTQYSQDGVIYPAGRSLLERRRRDLNLAPEVAETIIAEVLRPYEELRENLAEYEQVLAAELAHEFPLSDRALRELADLQRLLNLTDEAITPIRDPLIAAKQAASNPQQSSQRQVPQQPQTQQTPYAPPPSPSLPSQRFEFETATVRIVEKPGFFGSKTEIEIKRRQGQAEFWAENLGNGITLDMVAIPGGRFLMGAPKGEEGASSDEFPQHEVTVPPFFMGKYPVTQAQYEAIMGTNPAKFKGKNRPVERVSWDEAVAFCDRLSQKTGKSYRLPSEAEWEYACRAGTTTPFYFGETITPDLVNYDGNYPYGKAAKGNYRKQTTDVGSFPANAFGLYDMHGNVWEWCADPWHNSYDLAPNDGSVWQRDSDLDNNRRLLRGGSWFIHARFCRAAVRYWDSRVNRVHPFGFRLVCSLPRAR